ncbi:MAG TPA: hypothetical protein VKB88_46120 [Bryobacteraceae bacterium]|nr:hypothetical protein [Bryobacteraceae bacterium]
MVRRICWISVFWLSASAAMAQAPVISAGGIANGASFGLAPNNAVTPGSLISVFGTNLASATASADSIPLSNTLGNVSVMINGTPAPLNYVCHLCVGGVGDQLNIEMPWEVTGSTAQVVVTNNGSASAAATVNVAQFNPGIFSVNNGIGVAIAFFTDGALAAPGGSIPGLATRPAKAGDVLQIFATGLGAVDSHVNDGAAPTQLTNTLTKSNVMIGGMQVPVLFSGLAPGFVGIDQVNAQVPTGAPTGNTVPLQLQVGGLTSTNQVTIAVQ